MTVGDWIAASLGALAMINVLTLMVREYHRATGRWPWSLE